MADESCDLTHVERIGAHSHIHGLGLDDALEARDVSEGMVGQTKARKAAGIFIKMVKDGQIAGRSILLAGEPSTGKTAIAVGMAKELGNETPFISMSGSEFFSLELSKTEALNQALRKSIGVRMKEEIDFFEGEVINVEIDNPETDQKICKVTLKTTDMEATYDIGSQITDEFIKQNIEVGDVIAINLQSGKVSKLGRSFQKGTDYDATGAQTRFVQCPEGELQRRKEVVRWITVHEMDVISTRKHGVLALFSGETGEITQEEIRAVVNDQLLRGRKEGNAEIYYGVLFIDEAHMLDIECFSYLNRALESEMAPMVIMATNRGMTKVRGTNDESPHGIPTDFLDRMMIIRTVPFSDNEMTEILKMRCQEEDCVMSEEALSALTRIATLISLRYSIQLISTSNLVAKRRKAAEVGIEDIKKVYSLFIDEARSSEILTEYETDYMIDEESGEQETI